MASPAPPRIWTSFLTEAALRAQPPPADARLTAYRIESIGSISGTHGLDWQPGTPLLRLESSSALGAYSNALSGVTEHVLYTAAKQRAELQAVSAAESGPCAVLIPIRKSGTWWALAQDERLALFHGRGAARGHYEIGRAYAARIFRRLYHSRYLPGSSWDFLTYFEFSSADAPHFRELLAGLRDPNQNPEWAYVEAEVEVRLRKEAAATERRF
jgi:hypothetical protein